MSDAHVAASETSRSDPGSSRLAPPAFDPVLEHSADAIVAAGLRWLIVLRPETLLSKLSAAEVSFPDATRLSAFERSVGVHARSVSEAAIAGFDYSTLYVARLSPSYSPEVNTALGRFAARLDAPPVSQTVVSQTLLSGVRAATPVHYVELDRLTPAWSDGDPSPIKAASLASQLRLTVPSALRGASLSLLAEDCHAGDVVAYAPGPIERGQALSTLPSGVLDDVLAASIALRLNGDILEINGCAVGDWGADGLARVQALLEAVVAHRLFSLLELDETERRPELRQEGNIVFFGYAWRAQHTLNRIQALLELDLETLMTPPR